MSANIFFFVVLFVLISAISSKALIIANNEPENHKSCTSVARIGCVIDYTSRVGREQRMAFDLAIQDRFFIDSSSTSSSSSCTKLDLVMKNSEGNPARATATAIDLIKSKQVEAIVGTLNSPHEAALVSDSTNKKFPFISLTSLPMLTSFQPPNTLFQMANDVVFQMQCIAAVVGHFNWRKITAIYENDRFSGGGSTTLTLLSDSLQLINSEIEYHKAFPSLSLLSHPEKALEDELQKLKSKSNRVFIVFQFSLRSVLLLFEKAMRMGMMEQGYVWIVSDEIASLLDSVESSFMYDNMRGVIGIKTSFADTSKDFKRFKSRFRRMYGSKYPEEEENSSPSIFALRAYDSITAIAKAVADLQGKAITSKGLSDKLTSARFRGLSGMIRFKIGMLAQSPTFEIINVDGKSYREISLWSKRHGFFKNSAQARNKTELPKSTIRSFVGLGPITWPGGAQKVPQGWTSSSEERMMRIAIPAKGAFNQFVKVIYDQAGNPNIITGFSIRVFEAVLKRLPYQVRYELVPFNGSYDEMVDQVYYKGFDAAVGDIEIFADRFQFVDFTQPYVSSGLEMIVTVEPDKVKEIWMFKAVFSADMWLQLVLMHIFVCFVVWLIEHQHLKGQKKELKDRGFMLWLSILLFAQREPLESNVARFVMSPWLFVILVIMAAFTASLSSMLTVNQMKPSVLDIETLRRTNAMVGCNGNSFIVRYLIDALEFKPQNIKNISSVDEYPDLLRRGEIKAAFFVAPHAEVFLKNNCEGFVKSGPIHKLGGFGFAFPKGSPLVVDVSEAILQVTESGEVQRLENDMLLSLKNCSSSIELGSDGTIDSGPFYVLFTIAAAISAFAFLVTLVLLAGKRWFVWSSIEAMLISTRFWRWAYIFYDLKQRPRVNGLPA